MPETNQSARQKLINLLNKLHAAAVDPTIPYDKRMDILNSYDDVNDEVQDLLDTDVKNLGDDYDINEHDAQKLAGSLNGLADKLQAIKHGIQTVQQVISAAAEVLKFIGPFVA